MRAAHDLPELDRQHRGTILFAEDDARVREVGARMLENAGYQVVALGDGGSALEWFIDHHEQVDLLLLDAVMPGMDGRSVYQRLRDLSYQVPVLFCTGYDAKSPLGRELQQLGCSVIEKPFCQQLLAAAIAAAIGQPLQVDA